MFACIFSANGFLCFPCLPNPFQQRWGQAPRTNSSGFVVGYSLRKLLKRGRSMALPLRNNKPLGTVSEGAGTEKPPACRDEARWLVMSGFSNGPSASEGLAGLILPRRRAAERTSEHRMPRARVPLGDELWGYYHFVSESPPHVFTWQRLRSVSTVVCQK